MSNQLEPTKDSIQRFITNQNKLIRSLISYTYICQKNGIGELDQLDDILFSIRDDLRAMKDSLKRDREFVDINLRALAKELDNERIVYDGENSENESKIDNLIAMLEGLNIKRSK
jgi:hypothetical protein